MPENETHQLPHLVRVLGKPFFIMQPEEVRLGKVICRGLCDSEKGFIQVQRDLRHSEKQDTILHEFTHAISDTLGLKLTEHQVHGLAAGWHAVLSDNPELHQFLTPTTLSKLEP